MNKNGLEGKYEPQSFEDKLYKNWEERNYFQASVDYKKEPYTIVMPPPNITGVLHMGHAMDNTLQDILIRYKRAKGYNALWLPGVDHAALATEAKIVAKLKEEGTSKEELGREKFLERAWEWKHQYGNTITTQLRKIGCSCDWSKERFTMDEGNNEAVKKVFVDLYNKGLIYKGKRMVNWCSNCGTAISDAEVEFEEEAGHLWYVNYYSKDKSYYVTVATTRPETMLGDVAIAVNPNDPRYKDLVGKTVILPIMNKEIPLIADEFVEMEFGTGAVKITPAHDPNDYEAGLKHNLDIINVFGDDGKMLDLVKEYEGMDILTARKAIVERLEKEGNLIKTEDYSHNVGHCQRCHHTIEPKISTQWFVKMKPLAEPAIKAVKDGEVKFVPERFSKVYYNWMENIQDWCISRQIWWGHRIPVYYCDKCNEIHVGDEPSKCSKCGHTSFTQETDTLDTWFSSALWPFSTLGFPKETEEYKYFYPTSDLVTGYDIIFFWVARMIFSAIEHTGKVPFNTVYIHGLVRDSQGRKMSKSLGNGIDPLKVIEEYGCDALRFSLVLNTAPGNDLRYLPEKLESAKNFANKVWNASKFVLMNLPEDEKSIETCDTSKLAIEDKWILNKLNKTIKNMEDNLSKYELGLALEQIYSFIWDEFCDWYIEMVKPRLYSETCTNKKEAQYTLNYVLKSALTLLHPFMPFVSEKIYTNLANTKETIMKEDWPTATASYDDEETSVENLKQIIVGIRNVRSNMNIHPTKKSDIIFVSKDKDNILAAASFIQKLGFAENVTVYDKKENITDSCVTVVAPSMEAYLPLNELVDKEEELARIEREYTKLNTELMKLSGMINNPGFLAKAPANKVEETKIRVSELEAMINNLMTQKNNLINM